MISEFLFIKNLKNFPNFIGKKLDEFIKWAKEENIPFKIYSIKKDKNVENLIITNQSPTGNFSIKKNSIINLEINLIENYEEDFLKKNLEKIKNLKIEEAETLFLQNGFLFKKINIPRRKEENNKILSILKKNDKNLNIYIGKKNNIFFLNNSLEKKNCKEIKKLLSEKNLQTSCVNFNNEIFCDDHNLEIKHCNFSAGNFIKPEQIIYLWH